MPIIGYKQRFISLLSLCFFSMSVFSAHGHRYLGASLGASFGQLGNSTPRITYFSGDSIVDAYPLNSSRASTSTVGLKGGYEFTGANFKPAVALGLGLYTSVVDSNYKGQLIETAAGDASSTLYNYSYGINTTRVMAEIQLTWMLGQLSPFIDLGVGPAWNRMNGYSETAINSSGYPALPAFQSQNNINFAYQAGLGVSTAFNFKCTPCDFLQERITLGYRYVNLGKTSFGTRGAAYPYHLNTGLLQTNDVYLSYTHLF